MPNPIPPQAASAPGDPGQVADDLGLGLRPGSAHYRAYVGPPEDYDLISALTFGLATTLGLRQHHRVLDIGCGSLRVGRLLIPYLNRGNYTGIEPNGWLVEEGIRRETGADLVRIKEPHFHIAASTEGLPDGSMFDLAIAQSIFSHVGEDLLQSWMTDASARLAPEGALMATFLPSDVPEPRQGWVYPECTKHPPEVVARAAQAAGLAMHMLDWPHPRQSWALFAKPSYDLATRRRLLRQDGSAAGHPA